MGFRFKKSVKLGSGVKVNVNKRGGSLSFGGKGRSVNVGKRGVFGSVGLPGTGLSYRTRLDGKDGRAEVDAEENSLVADIKFKEVWWTGGIIGALAFILYAVFVWDWDGSNAALVSTVAGVIPGGIAALILSGIVNMARGKITNALLAKVETEFLEHMRLNGFTVEPATWDVQQLTAHVVIASDLAPDAQSIGQAAAKAMLDWLLQINFTRFEEVVVGLNIISHETGLTGKSVVRQYGAIFYIPETDSFEWQGGLGNANPNL